MCKWSRTSLVKRSGLTLMEMLVVLGITALLIGGIFSLLNNAQANFFNADASIDVRSNLRLASQRMSMDLRQTGYKAGVAQFAIIDGVGSNPDTIRFAIPVLCSTTAILLDGSGNPANWGAPLRWGCDQPSCMDANNSCAVLEYRYIQYSIASGQLVRSVLDATLNPVTGGVSTLGRNITDLQASFSGNQLTFNLTGQKTSVVRRTMTATYPNKVFLNNYGG